MSHPRLSPRSAALALLAASALAFNPAARAAESTPPTAFPVALTPLDPPAAPGACAPMLAANPDGGVYLLWAEPAPSTDAGAASAWSLRLASLDPATHRWTTPSTIVRSTEFSPNRSDPPQLAVAPGGRLAVLWHNIPAAGPHAHGGGVPLVSESRDAGATWSAPRPLTTESAEAEFASLAAFADGRVIAAWLDGRAKHAGGAQRLYARLVGQTGPDQLIDNSVCDCCHTALIAFPDGSALLAYRGRTSGEIRDIRAACFQKGAWGQPYSVNDDNWHIAGCPVNGPRVAACGGHVATAWFTAADNEPRVLSSTSPDAGGRFTLPQRVDLGHPTGRADVARLRDGTRLVTWIEAADPTADRPAALYLRRISPTDELNPPVQLAAVADPRQAGFPRLIVLKDYDAAPAQLLVVFSRGQDNASALQSLLVDLPALSTLAGRAPCPACDEADAAAARGFALRGRVVSLAPERGAVVVRHEAIPGVMRAMTMQFKVDPDTLAQLTPDAAILGRIERRGREWWLFNVQVLASAHDKTSAPSPRPKVTQ